MESHEHGRRELDGIARDNDIAMKHQAEALTRMVETDELGAAARDELVTGGMGRRQFLRFSGIAVATSAVIAACGASTTHRSASNTTPRTGPPSTAGGKTTMDITLLRTASSIEALAVATYSTAIGTGLVTNRILAAAARSFMEQHHQHAQLFESATSNAGGTPFTQPNPVVKARMIDPAVANIKTQNDILVLAYMLESAASQTYQSAIGGFSNRTYNTAVASVLGVESRHVALLGAVLTNPIQYPSYPPSGFQADTDAVRAGTGV